MLDILQVIPEKGNMVKFHKDGFYVGISKDKFKTHVYKLTDAWNIETADFIFTIDLSEHSDKDSYKEFLEKLNK